MNIHEFNSNFEPCIVEGLNPGQYHQVAALSNSRMEDFLVSPANYKWYLENPKEETDSMTFGTLVHTAILEPEELHKRYVARPLVDGQEVDMRTKAGKDFKAQAEAMGQEVVKGFELAAAITIAAQLNALTENNFNKVLEASRKELSLFWKHNSIPCKCRLDAYCESAATLIDVKTTKNAKLDKFERDAWSMGFHRKADWYRRGLNAHSLPCRHVLFIAIEKTGPRDFIIYRLQDDILDLGRTQNDKIMIKFGNCHETGVWPGYSKAIQNLGAPSWAIATLPEDELV